MYCFVLADRQEGILYPNKSSRQIVLVFVCAYSFDWAYHQSLDLNINLKHYLHTQTNAPHLMLIRRDRQSRFQVFGLVQFYLYFSKFWHFGLWFHGPRQGHSLKWGWVCVVSCLEVLRFIISPTSCRLLMPGSAQVTNTPRRRLVKKTSGGETFRGRLRPIDSPNGINPWPTLHTSKLEHIR